MEKLKTQKLEDFLKEMKDDLQRFEEYWKKNHEATPKDYPNRLPGGDWFEQFIMFTNDPNQ